MLVQSNNNEYKLIMFINYFTKLIFYELIILIKKNLKILLFFQLK